MIGLNIVPGAAVVTDAKRTDLTRIKIIATNVIQPTPKRYICVTVKSPNNFHTVDSSGIVVANLTEDLIGKGTGNVSTIIEDSQHGTGSVITVECRTLKFVAGPVGRLR